MGIFSSKSKKGTMSDNPETRQVEKMIASETKADQKNVDHALKDFKKADKMHDKSIKSADKAQHALDKAVKKEHKTAQAVNKAEHQHETAIANQHNASKTVELQRQHESVLEQDLQKRRNEFEELQQRKAANDVGIILSPFSRGLTCSLGDA
ncbi:hypothetical protein IEO21_07047 [Rhodonia placenta]|uniref:Uncharacterized protein n=1 Tax=Rhodonia placenta TaxID=104341 RepID=A0A8H7U0Q6_9APHY|nr:hypothetical protein IEO21_07047 [Postia placenta]